MKAEVGLAAQPAKHLMRLYCISGSLLHFTHSMALCMALVQRASEYILQKEEARIGTEKEGYDISAAVNSDPEAMANKMIKVGSITKNLGLWFSKGKGRLRSHCILKQLDQWLLVLSGRKQAELQE